MVLLLAQEYRGENEKRRKKDDCSDMHKHGFLQNSTGNEKRDNWEAQLQGYEIAEIVQLTCVLSSWIKKEANKLFITILYS